MAASSSSVSLFGFRQVDQNQNQMNQQHSSSETPLAPPQKKRRNQPGTPSNSSNSFSEHFSANGSIGGGNEATNFFTTGDSIMGGHHQQQQIVTSSAPSLFSTSLQSNNSVVTNTHHMSATALLQKVAQMSATSSNSTTSLLKSFGSITSSSSGSKPDHNIPLHVPAPHVSAIYSSILGGNENCNTFAASGNTSILEDGGSLGLTGFEPYNDKSNRRKQPRVHGVNIGGSDDRLTRDFLGVGEIVRNMSGGREQHGDCGSGGNFQ
ncbi:unnamed protein product [Lupinus luteus]|uniref:Uncharacterized protein n=1 Tax=Lupinus luteus TaxID=3873 RepID=A0AAV1XHC8_LUPLU